MVGYTEDELRTFRWAVDLTHEDDLALTDHVVVDFLEGRRQSYQIEKRYRRKGGEIIWLSVNASRVPGTDAVPGFYQAMVVDITDRKRAEDALQRAQAELARVSRVTTMGEFAASIAHEINQPLAAIVASGNACQRWLESGPNVNRAKESLNRIVSDANRASEVIKRIRALTRNRAAEHVHVDMNDVIDEVLTFTQNELQARRVTVRKELQADAPAVMGDRVQLQQVLLNLLMNAIEAMAPITDRRRELVITSLPDDQSNVVVTVQDSGTGLDPNDAERIFNAFFTTKADGMGMGLSISTSIIEAHGGRLWASPAVPHGTAFHFSVPAASGGPS
jgi:PAS domain S-box-containing protein